MIKKVIHATDLSLSNALYDLSLLQEFVKNQEFGAALRSWLFKKFWGGITGITLFFTSITLILALVASTVKIYEYLQKIKFFD